MSHDLEIISRHNSRNMVLFSYKFNAKKTTKSLLPKTVKMNPSHTNRNEGLIVPRLIAKQKII